METQNHLLTHCHFTSFLWFKAGEDLGLELWGAAYKKTEEKKKKVEEDIFYYFKV